MKQVMVLQHAECEAPGLIARSLENAGCAVKPIHTFNGDEVPVEIGNTAGLVIMGGPMGVYEYEKYPFILGEMHLIESALRENKPVLGVCLGSQLLASVLGSTVKKGKQREIGWHSVALSAASHDDPLCRGLDLSFMALHWHGDIFDLPANSVALASSNLTSCQAFRHGNKAYGFLFHMEITPGILHGMINAFTDELAQEGLDGSVIVNEAREHLPKLQAIGSKVFEQWAALL